MLDIFLPPDPIGDGDDFSDTLLTILFFLLPCRRVGVFSWSFLLDVGTMLRFLTDFFTGSSALRSLGEVS